ncbi:hypothetical protein AAIH46_07405 [Rhizobium sp. 0TCS1.26]|uniref:hypothetical protein n=1 Tax=Rhizobium sp. 0TCS1.26 TaxID=3142623 RepID=UPI003D2B1E08
MADRDNKSTTTGGSLDVKDAGLERIGSDRDLKQGEAEGKGLEQQPGEAQTPRDKQAR